jgi:hypothetical protein
VVPDPAVPSPLLLSRKIPTIHELSAVVVAVIVVVVPVPLVLVSCGTLPAP